MIHRIAIFCACCALTTGISRAQSGLNYPRPSIAQYYPLSAGELQPSLLSEKHPSYLTVKTTLIEEHQIVDFEQRAIGFERVDKAFGVIIWQYRYNELDDYINDRSKFAFADLWLTSTLDRLKTAAEKKKDFNPLQMELNVQYPTWAQRILGKDPPKLSITGFEEIIVSYEYNKNDVAGAAYDVKGTGGIVFDQNNQFTVNGSVGRLINVNIKASTKKGVDASDNDPFKNFKIEYKGEGNELEDEVVQEVSAGAMSFSMPGASLAGYTEGHQGLLGLKVKTKFGPLELTGVASQERGEAAHTSFDLVNGGNGNTVRKETEFLPNRMFFLDSSYLNFYLSGQKAPEGKKLDRKSLQVWIHSEQQTELDMHKPETKAKNKFCLDSSGGTPFKLLVEGRDYSIHELIDGCIRFDSATVVQETDILAICMATNDQSIKKGDLKQIRADTVTEVRNLWFLKNNSPQAIDPNFELAWRNVYDLTTDFDVSKFKLEVKWAPESGDSAKVNGTTLFSSILGLTDNTGTPYTTDKSIFDSDHHLLIIPPFKDKNGLNNHPFANPALTAADGKGAPTPEIYSKTQEQFRELKPKYAITMTGSSKKTSFQIGSGNIMDKSEKVTGQDGEVLVRDRDYTLDYQFGTLNLISKNAMAKTRIDVEYQSEALFVPKSKVFLGLHGEMKLPFGNNSFVGASILYQNAAGQAIIPKLGQEAYSKVLLDMNTKMDFEPKWMTVLMDKIPLLTTDDKSTASLDIEVANSRTNPNTDGQAYIDDFESSNRSFDFGLDERSWYQAAPPAYLVAADSILLHNPIAWTQWWYRPINTDGNAHDAMVQKTSMFYKVPQKRNPTSDEKYEPVMNFECQPAPENADLARRYTADSLKPWAGIMYPITSNSMDRTKDKYLEFYAKGDGGRLYIDMGEVSEDLCFEGGKPNHLSMNEDTTGTGSAAFDQNLDVGLDGKQDKDEVWQVPNEDATGWDSLRYNDPRLGTNYTHDPGKDNYLPYQINGSSASYIKNYPYVNGKQGNGPPYDSKDLLGDGLSTTENYYRRFIDFDSVKITENFDTNAHNYMVLPDESAGNAINGWHLFRIPLNDIKTGLVDSAGKPQWTRIRFIRLFWTGFKQSDLQKPYRIQFARMRLVRNEWQDQPVRIIQNNDTISEVKLTATSINTEDNPEYTTPPSIPRTTDDAGNIVKESALRLRYRDMHPGDTTLVKNILIGQSINLSAYTTLSMFVHGDSVNRPDKPQFFFRFGNDSATYYEFREPLYTGWDAHNVMTIDLHELARKKDEILLTKVDKSTLDSTFGLNGKDGKMFTIKFSNNRTPNFAGVTWMAMGVIRPSNTAPAVDSGEIWVDEMKVTGVHQFNGWATRATLSSSWAGFMNIGGRIDYTGADFQQMTNTDMKLGNTTLSGSAQASWAINKFLPSQWGITIPLGVSVSNAITRPTLVQNTDVYLTDPKTNTADGFMQMYKDYITMLFGRTPKLFGQDLWTNQETEAEHYQNASVSRTFYTGYDKASTSKNPFINMLIERLSLDYNYNYNLNQTARGRKSTDRNTDDYIDSTITQRYTGNIKYDLSPKPAPNWTKWKPFADSKLSLLPERFKTYELSLLPTTLNFNLAEISYTTSRDIKNNSPELGGRTEIPLKNLTLMHNANLAYEPLSILKLNYTLTINRNLDNDVNNSPYFPGGVSLYDKWKTLFKKRIAALDPVWGDYYILADERDRNQNTTFNFDPTIWDWLTVSADYSSNYKNALASLQNQNDPTSYLNLNVNSTFHLTSTLNVSTLFKKLADGLPNAKTAAGVFSSIEKGLGKIQLNAITFNYNAAMSLVNNYLDRPLLQSKGVTRGNFLFYQLGWNGRTLKDIFTGNMKDDVFGGMHFRDNMQRNDRDDRRTSDRSYSASTSFSLPDPIGVSISNLGVRYSKSYTVQPDPAYRDTTITWPDFDVSATSQVLNKIKLVTDFIQNVTMTSSYKFLKKTETKLSPSSNDTITSTQNNFSPLIGLDGKLKKWPISVSYSYTLNTTSDASKLTGKSTSSDYTNKLTLSYELQKSSDVSEFRLLLWTIPLKGTFSVGLDGELGGGEKTQEGAAAGGAPPTTQTTSHYSIGPHSTYSFSDNITGTLSLSTSHTKSESLTNTSYIFKLSVNIALK